MSIRQLSSEVAKRGRNGDTMLIHVNPREVAGLQYLGERYGAKMTVNPDTGLPEAFNFMRFMPMIAGAALSPFITPMGAAAVVGAVEGARTNSIMGGIKGALGAYGGAGLGTSLASFGAEGLGQSALSSAIPSASSTLQAVPPVDLIGESYAVGAGTGAGAPGVINPSVAGSLPPPPATFTNVGPDQAGEMLRAGQITPESYAQYGQTLAKGVSQYNPTTFSNMGEGISRAFKDPTAAGKALIADPMTTAARLGSLAISSQEDKPYEPPEKKTYASSTKADPYKRNYRENPNPYDTSSEFEYFRPNALYVKEGGYIGMQGGGTPPVGMPTGLPDDYTAYMQQLQQMINLKGSPAGLPQFSAPISQPGFGTQMTKASRPNTYADGGQINLQGSFNLNPNSMGPQAFEGSKTGGPGMSLDMMRPQPAVLPRSQISPGGPGGYGTQMALGGITRIQKEGQVRGNGDGMEDKVYGNIEGRQKVALSRDEFIVPADVVSGLGNGSSNAGADKLYKMMDRVRKARTGVKKQGKQIKGDRYVPA